MQQKVLLGEMAAKVLILRSHAAIVSEKIHCFHFFIKKYLKKFNFAVKKAKVKTGSLFEQTMIGRNPKCYIQGFVEAVNWFRRRTFLKGFSIYGHCGHLGHVINKQISFTQIKEVPR